MYVLDRCPPPPHGLLLLLLYLQSPPPPALEQGEEIFSDISLTAFLSHVFGGGGGGGPQKKEEFIYTFECR